MKLVCLDNHILIWGIKEEATEGQEEMIPKAKRFFKWLEDEGVKVLIPANVIAEFLMLIPHEEHGKVIALFDKHFIVVPFDTAAASCFAGIWRERNDDGTIELVKKKGVTKNKITFDCQIVAIAVTHGASCIYSHDEDIEKFAGSHIEVKQMPEIFEQMYLPDTE
ncbi:type II toxin-antitoxin system VapC family toxin [Nitrospirota bacterium]